MLKKLILQNFRQHEALTVNFAGGLNVIKGANESGKSSLYEAVIYALYGAKALPLKLEDTVTWLKPVGTLCVTLVFDHAGIEYTIVRKKSGATLSCKDFTASGHAEVSAVVERILNVNLFVASAVTVVSQNSLQTLTTGAAGIKLIEGLSDVNYIDRLVTKLSAELACGNTKLLETQLAELSQLTAPEPVPEDLQLHVQKLKADLAEAKSEEAQHGKNWNSQLSLVATLESELKAHKAYVTERSRLEQALEQAKYKLEKLVIPDDRSEELANLRSQIDRAAEIASAAEAAQKALAWFKALKIPEVTYSKSALEKRHRELQVQLAPISDEAYNLAVLEAKLETGIVKLGECSFCGLDLNSVPKVAAENAVKETELLRIRTRLRELDSAKLDIVAKIHDIGVKLTNCKSITRYPVGYVATDPDIIPSVFTWIGGEPHPVPDTSSLQSYAMVLKAHEEGRAKASALAAGYGATITERSAALSRLPIVKEPTGNIERAKMELHVSQALYSRSQDRLRTAEVSAYNAEVKLQAAKVEYAVALSRYTDGMNQLAGIRSMLEAYNENNALIRRLREIRPQVAKRLWDSVLTFASQILASIRQSTSLITHNSDEFLINGRSAAAYSGSARDMLGVAIRVALQKTFLPSLDFIMVDEPAGACDAPRETELLGKLAALDYRQVLVITHSELADSFATNLIQLGET